MASKKTKPIFPTLKRIFVNLIANDLVSVQPMTMPSSLIFYTDYVYDTPEQNLIKEKQKIKTTLDSIIGMDNQENKI